MVTTFKAIAKKTKTGLQVESGARNFKIIMDEPASLGGSNTGMNPVEAVICAFAAVSKSLASGEKSTRKNAIRKSQSSDIR